MRRPPWSFGVGIFNLSAFDRSLTLGRPRLYFIIFISSSHYRWLNPIDQKKASSHSGQPTCLNVWATKTMERISAQPQVWLTIFFFKNSHSAPTGTWCLRRGGSRPRLCPGRKRLVFTQRQHRREMTFYKPRRRRQRHPIEQETALFFSSGN